MPRAPKRAADGLPRLRHPIVLIHGLGALAKLGPIDYYYGIPRRLLAAENRVLMPKVKAWEGVEHRATAVHPQIERAFGEEPVILLGHSQGGLEARYLASRLAAPGRVAAVVTIGTPNRGSSLADLVASVLPEGLLPARIFPQAMLQRRDGKLAMDIPDAPEVRYFSATTVIRRPIFRYSLPQFWSTYALLRRAEGDNDGFVSLESARWGEHVCTHFGDHYAQIGHPIGRTRGLDHLQFYREILERLRAAGL